MPVQSRRIIESWMSGVIASENFLEFDDLHVDQIDEAFGPQPMWLTGAFECLREAVSIRNDNRWPVVVAVGIPLASGSTMTGVTFSHLSGIVAEFERSPPSLYVFETGAEPWRSADCVDLGQEHALSAGEYVTNAFFCEWYHEGDHEYRRSVWFAG